MNNEPEIPASPVQPGLPGHDRADAQSNQDQFKFALMSAGMGTWNWDVPANVVRLDAQMCILLGVESETFEGRFEDFLARVHPEDRERVSRDLCGAVGHCAEFDGEFRVILPADQSVHFIRMRSKACCDDARCAQRVVGVAWDTTECRQAQEERSIDRGLITTLMDHLPDNIYFKDKQSRFIAVSSAMAKAVGFKEPAQLLGKTDFDIFTAEHADAAFRDEQEILRSGVPIVNLEEKETWPDGRETWVLTTKMPLRDANGKLIGTFGLSRDITERKRADQELARLAEELREKNRALEEDLDMARELQNAMLPHRYPSFPHNATENDSAVRFYHFFKPSASLSGDFFDVLDISDTAAGLFICDVMGHGVRAALVAATVRAVVSELRAVWDDPGAFLSQLNRSLRTALDQGDSPIFASAFYLVADLANGEMRYSNAGHPNPLRVRPAEVAEPHELSGEKPGPALALFDNVIYKNCRSSLSPRDIVLLFTDGLFEVEGPNGELYDYRHLVGAVSKRGGLSARRLCSDVVDEVREFSAGHDFSDDVCVVAMEIGKVGHALASHP